MIIHKLNQQVPEGQCALNGVFTSEELRKIADELDKRNAARNAPKDTSKVVECRPENFAKPDFSGLTAKTTDD